MKKISKVVVIALFAFLMFSLTACGNNNGVYKPSGLNMKMGATNVSIDFDEITESDRTLYGSLFEVFEDISIEISKDEIKFVSMENGEKKEETYNYEKDGDKITILDKDGNAAIPEDFEGLSSITLKGGVLTISISISESGVTISGTITFKKS